jgi:hypothetical protein
MSNRISITTQLLLATALVIIATAYLKTNHVSTFFKAGAEEKQISVTFIPNKTSVPIGQSVTTTPIITTKSKKPGFILITFIYDARTMTFTGTDDSHLSDAFEKISEPVDQIDTTNPSMHTIQITYAIKNPANPPGDTIQLSKLSFKANTTGESSVHIDSGSSQIVFLDQDIAVLETNTFTVTGL